MSGGSLEVIALGALLLAGVGMYGLLVVRNLIKVIVALQILVKGTLLALVAAGSLSGQINLGQSLAVTVIVVDTIVAVVGLGLAVRVRQRLGTLDLREISTLRG
ncbi:MAG: NADH-quinone oxidoreductase subunit NuoK [Aggregatilineales bacterium]